MNILYLDIDGPMSSRRAVINHGKRMGDCSPIDPMCTGLMKYIIETCDLKVYVHSSLAKRMNHTELSEKLGFEVLPLGNTTGDRVQRVKAGLEMYKPDKYIVLDDYNLSAAFGENFLLVNADDGISWDVFCTVLEFFGKKEPMILM